MVANQKGSLALGENFSERIELAPGVYRVSANRMIDGPHALDAKKLGELGSLADFVTSDKRLSDLWWGRECARRALGGSVSIADIGRDIETGEALWPKGVLGSITHTPSYVTALVADAERYDGVGIDAEAWLSELRARRISKKLFCSEYEKKCVEQESTKMPTAELTTLIFSAKECIFKAFFTSVRRMFWFEAFEFFECSDAHIRFVCTQALHGPGGELCIDKGQSIEIAWEKHAFGCVTWVLCPRGVYRND